MGFLSILSYAHQCIKERISSGEIAIDATVGNGVDTVFLTRLVGPKGKVYGFDIQQQALLQTTSRAAAQSGACAPILFLTSHADMATCIPVDEHGHIGAAMFNLGYLPGADPQIITVPQSTIPALHTALAMLRHQGILTISLYPGHKGGLEEAHAVAAWAAELLPEQYQVLRYQFVNRGDASPYLLAIIKR